MAADLLAEKQQRAVHIGHSRQISGVDRRIQRIRHILWSKHDPVMFAVDRLHHFLHIVRIRIGLKFRRVKILLIVFIIQ